jgi:hypothetical protein
MRRAVLGGLLLPACLLWGAPRAESGALRIRVPGSGVLLIVPRDAAGARWYRVVGRRRIPIPAPPVSFLPVQALASPDGRHLAVVSAGEGHPVLDLLDLPRLLKGRHGRAPLLTVDPYPGMISLEGWTGGRLRISSDRPLDTCCTPDHRVPGEQVLDAPRLFQLDPASGGITGE